MIYIVKMSGQAQDELKQILSMNRVVGEFAGVPPVEFIGKKCCRFIHGTERQLPGCLLRKMRNTRKREKAEFQILGDGRWITVTVDPVEDGNGDLIAGVHIVRDIAEQRRAQEALRISEGKLSE